MTARRGIGVSAQAMTCERGLHLWVTQYTPSAISAAMSETAEPRSF